MKQRTFYVVNLDRSRIMMLLLVLVGFVLISFASGIRYGRMSETPSMNVGAPLGSTQSPSGAASAGIPPDALGAPVADPALLGASKREIPRSPEEVEGLVKNSLRTPKAPGVAEQKLQLPERREMQPSGRTSTETRRPRDTRKTARRDRREKARVARQQRAKDATHRQKQKGHRKAANDHAPRTALRNTAHVERINKIAPGPTPEKRGESDVQRPAERYLLQVGTYRYASAATRRANLLKKQGFPARVSRSGRVYRVFVGGALEKAASDQLHLRLKKRKHAPIKIRLKARPADR